MKLHIYCLPQITNYFFIFNHPNYVRWLVPYHDNHDEFNKGCFGIKINKKDFSRLPIDLTLEQIVADTSSQRLEFPILQIQHLQDSDGLIVTSSEWRFFQKF